MNILRLIFLQLELSPKLGAVIRTAELGRKRHDIHMLRLTVIRFHILLRGTLPFKGKNNLAGVEIYKAARYFIMTGDTLLYREIIENQEAIDYVVEKYFPETRESSGDTLVGRDSIYSPIWEEPIVDGRVKLRPVYPRIPDGSRNICLTSLAGMLHNQGYSKAQIYEELLYANTVACDPPLDRSELRTICNSVTRYKR